MNRLGELRWSLSGVTAQLIHLAGGGFDMQHRFIFDGLLHGCRNDAGVSRADGVNSHFFGAAIAADDLPQSHACVLGLRFHGRPR